MNTRRQFIFSALAVTAFPRIRLQIPRADQWSALEIEQLTAQALPPLEIDVITAKINKAAMARLAEISNDLLLAHRTTTE